MTDEEIFDENMHKMTFIVTKSNPELAESKPSEDLFCNLCNDEIDGVFGYFACLKCKQDYCKECALDRGKLESEMAENPILVATPMIEISRDSTQVARKAFNFAIIQNEVQRGSSFMQRKEYQQDAGQFLTDDLKFEYELKELGLKNDQFKTISDKLFADSADKFVFRPRPND